jgi:4-diphosphocytidyl-2-C-methyl-D-erythritol kinase
VRVPAKINLHLAVGDVRPDGYHEIATVFQALNLVDDVTVTAAVPGALEPGIELVGCPQYTEGRPAGTLDTGSTDHTGPDASAVPTVPLDGTNLAWRAAETLACHVGREAPDVRIALRKAIPVAGGMAGGSADAAGTLLALNALWRLDLGRETLTELAGEIGADVAFALAGGTALGTGRGEKLVPVLARHTFHWVLALQDQGLSTPAVYGELDRLRAAGSAPRRAGDVEPLLSALASGEPHALALLLGNDLQAAAVTLEPALRRTLRAGVDAGALAGIVSGSGPTCVFLCADADAAVRVAAELSGAGVCRAVRVAHGPVPGARVIEGDPGDRRPPRGPVHPGPGAYA